MNLDISFCLKIVHTSTIASLTASPTGNWTRPLGRPRITWMKTIQQDLKSSDLNMDDAVDLAQNRPLWRLMSTFGATHSCGACQK